MIDIYYSRIACNTYVMYNDNDEGFLVDPGFNENNALINHLKKINKNIKAILITHGHYDHISALEDVIKLYPEAKVYISIDEKEFLTNKKLNLSSNSLDFVPDNLILISHQDAIDIAGYKIKVIATPFHTIGSVCYYIESENVLFSGDSLFYTTIGRYDLPTGNHKTINSSLSRITILPDETKVYPGHGVITSLDREKKHNSYLKNI